MISSEEGIRLAKRVAADQNCSRREAEALIVAGGVKVDGQVVTDPPGVVVSPQANPSQPLGLHGGTGPA